VDFDYTESRVARIRTIQTAALLAKELALLPLLPAQIFVCHIKPFYEEVIRREIAELGIPALSVLHDDQEIFL
jgi:hypothetical protein